MDINQRIDLIILAINYCQQAKKYGMPPAAYSKALREPIHYLWERRNSKNKIKCARYRSKMAYSEGLKGAIYDHALPFIFVQRKLLSIDLKPQNVDENRDFVRNVLSNFCVAALITRSEDAILNERGFKKSTPCEPDNCKVIGSLQISPHELLARYKECGIEIEENEGIYIPDSP